MSRFLFSVTSPATEQGKGKGTFVSCFSAVFVVVFGTERPGVGIKETVVVCGPCAGGSGQLFLVSLFL